MSLYGLIVCAALAQGTLPPCVADLDAQETPTPVQQARLLLQAFGFDRALENRGGLKIAVLYAEDLSEAEPMRTGVRGDRIGRSPEYASHGYRGPIQERRSASRTVRRRRSDCGLRARGARDRIVLDPAGDPSEAPGVAR